MAPAPGDLLRLSDLEINNKVQAMFEDGFWYNAYVLDKTGRRGGLCGAKVAFVAWRKL